MTRSKSITIAAILQCILGILEAMDAMRILAGGINGLPPPPGSPEGVGGPPFGAGVLFMVLAIAGLFGAYGLWINQKWGKIVTVITRVIFGLFTLGDIWGTVYMQRFDLAFVFVTYLVVSILIIFLVLRRETKLVMA